MIIWTVRDVLSAAECDALIARIEMLGPQPAPITTARGFVMAPSVRNNDRVMFDDVALAAKLFARIRPALPPELEGRVPVGANERLRCYRYREGQRFRPHFDGAFRRDDDEESALTLMVYLNDGFAGGETAFLDHERVVVPRRGMALLFTHLVLHEGREVTRGVKYALRSDVMYRDPAPAHRGPAERAAAHG